MNLLDETIGAIEESGHTIKDIAHIGNNEYGCDWEEFIKLADFEYYEGYGGQEISSDLRVYFSDGLILYRAEYDGSEWWSWQPLLIKKHVYKPIKSLKGDLWDSLEELNK